MKIRNVKINDLVELANNNLIRKHNIKILQRHLKNENYFIFVAGIDNEIIGYIHTRKLLKTRIIENTVLKKKFYGRGIVEEQYSRVKKLIGRKKVKKSTLYFYISKKKQLIFGEDYSLEQYQFQREWMVEDYTSWGGIWDEFQNIRRF